DSHPLPAAVEELRAPGDRRLAVRRSPRDGWGMVESLGPRGLRSIRIGLGWAPSGWARGPGWRETGPETPPCPARPAAAARTNVGDSERSLLQLARVAPGFEKGLV